MPPDCSLAVKRARRRSDDAAGGLTRSAQAARRARGRGRRRLRRVATRTTPGREQRERRRSSAVSPRGPRMCRRDHLTPQRAAVVGVDDHRVHVRGAAHRRRVPEGVTHLARDLGDRLARFPLTGRGLEPGKERRGDTSTGPRPEILGRHVDTAHPAQVVVHIVRLHRHEIAVLVAGTRRDAGRAGPCRPERSAPCGDR